MPGRVRLLWVFGLLAGCAQQPADKFGQAAPRAETLVATFLDLCGRLDEPTIAARSRALGFAAQPAGPPAPFKRLDETERVYVRAAGPSRSMLRWSARDGECSLAANDADPQSVTTELKAAGQRIDAAPVPVGGTQPNGARIAVAYREPSRLVFMGVNERQGPKPLVVLVARAEAIPPPAQGPAKR
jgi:hypothetical protein